MTDLTAAQIRALKLLGERHKNGGQAWVNIAHAGALAALGLARHGRNGWAIMPEGLQKLAELEQS
jgi:hypothetical protein